MTLSLVIQAGGESRRMGINKALLLFHGRPMIERIIDRLSPIADEILITCNQPEELSNLGWPVIKDRLPGKGALGGLYTALSVARCPYVAVVACDMPFASQKLFVFEHAQIQTSAVDVVIPGTRLGLEPLHAVYRRDRCLAAVEKALEDGLHRMTSWFKNVRVSVLTQDQIESIDPYPHIFVNVNTPNDFSHAEKLEKP